MLPSGISEEEVGYAGASVLCVGISVFSTDPAPAWFEDNGMAHLFDTWVATVGESRNEWFGVETVLVRLNSSYASNANFPVWTADPIENMTGSSNSRIGYDAVTCVEMHEPWIVQIYNSSLGVPTTMAIAGKSATTDFETDDGNKGPHLDSYTRSLNITGKYSAYYVRYAGGFSFERY